MADVVPDSRKVRWDLAGIPGGIAAPGSIYATFDSTGDETNRAATIQAALNAAGVGAAVQLGPGAFYITSTLTIPAGRVLMGSGISATRLVRIGGDHAVRLGDGALDYPWATTGDAITDDVARGSTVLPMAGGTSNWVAGDIMVLTQTSPDYGTDPAAIEFRTKTGYSDRLRRQYVEVVSKTSDTVTISIPTYWALESARSPVAHRMARSFHTGSGVRDLTIDCSEGATSTCLRMWGCVRAYAYRVAAYRPRQYGIHLLSAFQCEIKECAVDLNYGNGGPNGAGIIVERASANRVWDNIILRAFPHLEINWGCSGNVIAYNFAHDSSAGYSTDRVQGGSLNVNHEAHNSFDLIEGNCAPSVWSDGYYGTASELVFARNRLHGTNEDGLGDAVTQTSRCVDLNRFSRKMLLVGNILGMTQAWWSSTHGLTMIKEPITSNYGKNHPLIYKLGYPNLGNESFSGTASLINADPWSDWPDGVGTGKYQERDLDVVATLTRKANWNGFDDAIHESEALGEGETIASSYFLAEKPDWFGTLAWPPYDSGSPVVDLVESAKRIPAGYRYYMGTNPAPTLTPYAFPVRRSGFGFGIGGIL